MLLVVLACSYFLLLGVLELPLSLLCFLLPVVLVYFYIFVAACVATALLVVLACSYFLVVGRAGASAVAAMFFLLAALVGYGCCA